MPLSSYPSWSRGPVLIISKSSGGRLSVRSALHLTLSSSARGPNTALTGSQLVIVERLRLSSRLPIPRSNNTFSYLLIYLPECVNDVIRGFIRLHPAL